MSVDTSADSLTCHETMTDLYVDSFNDEYLETSSPPYIVKVPVDVRADSTCILETVATDRHLIAAGCLTEDQAKFAKREDLRFVGYRLLSETMPEAELSAVLFVPLMSNETLSLPGYDRLVHCVTDIEMFRRYYDMRVIELTRSSTWSGERDKPRLDPSTLLLTAMNALTRHGNGRHLLKLANTRTVCGLLDRCYRETMRAEGVPSIFLTPVDEHRCWRLLRIDGTVIVNRLRPSSKLLRNLTYLGRHRCLDYAKFGRRDRRAWFPVYATSPSTDYYATAFHRLSGLTPWSFREFADGYNSRRLLRDV